MSLKFGEKYQISAFLGFCSVSGRDKGFLSRQSFLVATLVATYCLSRHRSRHTAACRDTGRDILLCEYSLESSLNVECSHEGI